MNERPVDVQSRGLTEAAAESESPMLHKSKWTPVWVSILINRNTGIRTGAEVSERPVDVQNSQTILPFPGNLLFSKTARNFDIFLPFRPLTLLSNGLFFDIV